MLHRFRQFFKNRLKNKKVSPSQSPISINIDDVKDIVVDFFDDWDEPMFGNWYEIVEIEDSFMVFIRRENRPNCPSNEEIESLVDRIDRACCPVSVYGIPRVDPWRSESNVFIFDNEFIDRMIDKYFTNITTEIITKPQMFASKTEGNTVYLRNGKAIMRHDKKYCQRKNKDMNGFSGAVIYSYNLWHEIDVYINKYTTIDWVTFALLGCMFKSKFGISAYSIAGGGDVYDSGD